MITIEDMVESGLCTGCGVCISESKNVFEMEWNEDGFLTPNLVKTISKNDSAIKVCPFNPYPEEAVKDEDSLAQIFFTGTSKYDDKVGFFEDTYVGYSKKHRSTSSSGGIATYVFEELLSKQIVNWIFVVKEQGGSYEYQLFNSVEDVLTISKTRYIPVTMDKLFATISEIKGTVAVSGVGCFIKAIRLKQHYHPELKKKIPFLVGIICGGWKSRFFTEYLVQSTGIQGMFSNQDYRIKDVNSLSSDYSFGAYDSLGVERQMKMSKVGDMWGSGLFKARVCDFCTDVLTELADISLGDAWLPEYRIDGRGHSVIVARTKLANQLLQDGLKQNKLELYTVPKEKIIQSQSASFSHRRDALHFRIKRTVSKEEKIPYVRKRVLNYSISKWYSLVQVLRLKTREKSILYWKESPNVVSFNQRMKAWLFTLRLFTKIYHILR